MIVITELVNFMTFKINLFHILITGNKWSWIVSVYKMLILPKAKSLATSTRRNLLRKQECYIAVRLTVILDSIFDLSFTLKTPLIRAVATFARWSVMCDRRSPRSWVAPSGTRVATAPTVFLTAGFTEANFTSGDEARRQRSYLWLRRLDLWTGCVNFCRQSTDLLLHGLDLWLQRVDAFSTFSHLFLQILYCSHLIRHTV